MLCFSDVLDDHANLIVFERGHRAHIDVIRLADQQDSASSTLRGMLCTHGHMRALVPKTLSLENLLSKHFVQRTFGRVGSAALLASACDSDPLPAVRLTPCKICAALHKTHEVRRVGVESGVLAIALHVATRVGFSCQPWNTTIPCCQPSPAEGSADSRKHASWE